MVVAAALLRTPGLGLDLAAVAAGEAGPGRLDLDLHHQDLDPGHGRRLDVVVQLPRVAVEGAAIVTAVMTVAGAGAITTTLTAIRGRGGWTRSSNCKALRLRSLPRSRDVYIRL